MAANHVGLHGSPRPQKQKDWAAVAGKTSQTGGGQSSRWQLAPCFEFFEVYEEKGVWWADGGSGEGGLTVSCQDCMCEGSSSRADNGLKSAKLLTEKDTVPAKTSGPPSGNTINQGQLSSEAPTQCSDTCSSQHVGYRGQ